MSEESKKIEKIEQEAKESEVSDQDLENAAGGGPCSEGQTLAHVGGCQTPTPTAAKGSKYVTCAPLPGPPSTL